MFLGGKRQQARKANNLTAICKYEPTVYKMYDVVASTYHNPMGLHGLLQGQLYLLFTFNKKGKAVETHRVVRG
jgi:hypothetical protein